MPWADEHSALGKGPALQQGHKCCLFISWITAELCVGSVSLWLVGQRQVQSCWQTGAARTRARVTVGQFMGREGQQESKRGW